MAKKKVLKELKDKKLKRIMWAQRFTQQYVYAVRLGAKLEGKSLSNYVTGLVEKNLGLVPNSLVEKDANIIPPINKVHKGGLMFIDGSLGLNDKNIIYELVKVGVVRVTDKFPECDSVSIVRGIVSKDGLLILPEPVLNKLELSCGDTVKFIKDKETKDKKKDGVLSYEIVSL